MLAEFNEARKFFGAKFGYGNDIPNGTYAIPTETSKGAAFMKIIIKDGKSFGEGNFHLFWDEQLTISWYSDQKPESPARESEFSKAFRKLNAKTNERARTD